MLNAKSCLVLVAGILALVPSRAVAQDSAIIKKQCYSVLTSAIAEGIESSNATRIGLARELPLQSVRGLLVKALMNGDVQVRLISAEILAEKSPDEFADVIKKYLLDLEIAAPIDAVRRTAVLRLVGDTHAAEQITHLADLHGTQVATNGWMCPMQCAKSLKDAGRCPVCAMSLVKAIRVATVEDWQSRILALAALQSAATKIDAKARSILTSDADAFTRLQAAGLWAKEDPNGAMPHLKLYVETPYRNEAVWLMAEHPSDNAREVFQSILREPKSESLIQIAAYRGLLNLGERHVDQC